MRPVLEAKELMESFGDSFIEKLDEHLTNGWVYSGEDCFVMASLENSESLLGRNLNKNLDDDVWFVYIYVGNLRRVLELIPFHKEFVAFRRDNGKVKLYRMENLLKKIGR